MSAELNQNPNVFYHCHEADGETTEIFIDFHNVVTFCKTSNDKESGVRIAVKYTNHSKANFAFPTEEPYLRFCKEYNEYVEARSSIKVLAEDMAKDLISEVKAGMAEETRNIVSSLLNDIQKSVSAEMEDFKNNISIEAKNITDTALQHQVKINKENEVHLKQMSELQNNTIRFVERIEDFSGRLEGIVSVINSVAPSAESLIEETENKTVEMNEEVSNY